MKLMSPLKIVLACGISCGVLGCKSPTAWFSGTSPAASTAPVVQYNGTNGASSAVTPNAGTTVVSGESPGMMSRAWGSFTSLMGTAPKKDATSLSTKPGKIDADLYVRAAHFAEQGGKYQEAETKYQLAL